MKQRLDSDHKDRYLAGTSYAIAAFGLWGILPVYWKLLQRVSAYEIVANRVVWTCFFSGILLLFMKKTKQVKHIIRNKKQVRGILICSLLLSVNWLTFVYAVNSGHVLDASMGYYINPLISVFLGLLVLKEKVNIWQKAAILLAFAGVFLVTFQYGKFPWIALTLAITFGFYGLVKKTGQVDPIIGLTAETLLMVPLALLYQVFLLSGGGAQLLRGPMALRLLLLSTGVITAVPLLLFSAAAQKIPLSRVGFVQYLTPSCFFLLGCFVYKEAFSDIQLISFICIWCALIIYSFSNRLPVVKPKKL